MSRRRTRPLRRAGLVFTVLGSLVLALLGVSYLPADSHAGEPESAAAAKSTKPEGNRREARSQAPRAKLEPFPDDSPWASRAACEAALVRERRKEARAERARRSIVRAGTWNLQWFPDGHSRGPSPEHARDVPWIACLIAWLDLDVLAVQEVLAHPRGREALVLLTEHLDAYTGGRFAIELDGCPDDGRQHLGFLYDRARLEPTFVRDLRELNPGRGACDRRLRPGVLAGFQVTRGAALELLSVHLDSGQMSRDYENRRASFASLMGLLAAREAKSAPLIVLGDFNTMGCERCEARVTAAEEYAALLETAARGAHALEPISAPENCSHYYRGRPTLLDHVFTAGFSPELRRGARLEAHGLCRELGCERLPRGAKPAVLERVSDHCPLVLELRLPPPSSERGR